jgi:hypothetical protein
MNILFCSVPGTLTNDPILAPAVLKACAESAGFGATALDLNIEIVNRIQNYKHKSLIEKFFIKQEIDELVIDEIGNIIEYCADRIMSYNPTTVGLSLLTQDNQFFTVWLCHYLKSVQPTLKIVIGGSGIKNFIAQANVSFAELLRDIKLIDDYIYGDGENAVVEYLKGNYSYPGINSNNWQGIADLNSLPQSDFSDYNFTQYTNKGIPICDSRGCVRACEFCDIIEHWKKYQYRTADNIFAEMLSQIKKYNITHFLFYNSLTNGNMKEFTKLLDLISNYNDTHTKQISWVGYFIVRTSKQHPESFWQKIKKTNGKLQLGIESVVEKVRIALGKNFSNADIDYHLEMAKKYSIPVLLLLIVGYPTETKDDFEFTKQWFIDRKQYARHPVFEVVTSLAAVLPNTELDRKRNEYGIVSGEIPTIWLTPVSEISVQYRLQYLGELLSILKAHGFMATSGNDHAVVTANTEAERAQL